MGFFQMKHRSKMFNKFRFLFLLSTAKKGTRPSPSTAANCCSKDILDSDYDQCDKPVHLNNSNYWYQLVYNNQQDEHTDEEELVAGRISVKEYLKPSERLVFEPAGSTRSILEAAKVPFPDCLVVAVDTRDPRADFRASMEEMVEELGLDGSDQLAELLAWYLRMNIKENHCYIVEAFVEMFTGSSSLVCRASNEPNCLLAAQTSTRKKFVRNSAF